MSSRPLRSKSCTCVFWVDVSDRVQNRFARIASFRESFFWNFERHLKVRPNMSRFPMMKLTGSRAFREHFSEG